MARKTTALVKELINRHTDTVHRVTDILNMINLGIDIPGYMQAYNSDYWIGLVDGQAAMLEAIMMESNCYHGFQHVDEQGNIVSSESMAGYRPWRRRYLIKE